MLQYKADLPHKTWLKVKQSGYQDLTGFARRNEAGCRFKHELPGWGELRGLSRGSKASQRRQA